MIRQLFVLGATIISLFGIYYINSGQTSLKTTQEVAGREPVINYALPPGYIFSIWGLIYLGFLLYALIQARPALRNNVLFRQTGWLAGISMLMNLAWIVIVGLEYWLAAYFLQWSMLALAVLLLLNWDLEFLTMDRFQKWLSIPFALYAGWLTVAMIPFSSDLLNQWGWNRFGISPITWAIILYIVAFLIMVLAQRRLRQPFFILPLTWAYLGFFTRFDNELRTVALVMGILSLVFFILSFHRFYRAPSLKHP